MRPTRARPFPDDAAAARRNRLPCRPASDLRSSAAWVSVRTSRPSRVSVTHPLLLDREAEASPIWEDAGFPPQPSLRGAAGGSGAVPIRRSEDRYIHGASRGVGTIAYRRAPHTAVAITRDRATSDPSAPSQLRPGRVADVIGVYDERDRDGHRKRERGSGSRYTTRASLRASDSAFLTWPKGSPPLPLHQQRLAALKPRGHLLERRARHGAGGLRRVLRRPEWNRPRRAERRRQDRARQSADGAVVGINVSILIIRFG